jgi:hypothetical protein
MGRPARTREFLPSQLAQMTSNTNKSVAAMASSSSTSKRWIVAVHAASSHVPQEASEAE